MNRKQGDFAKLQILRYVETCFTCLSDLANPEIEGLTNKPAHGLSGGDLVAVLDEMFQARILVASREDRGLFTPSRREIEKALSEPHGRARTLSNTYYGLTSAGNESLRELGSAHGAQAT